MGAINAGYSFGATEEVTNTKLGNLVNNATINASAITTAMITNLAVTQGKIAAGAVGTGQIADDAVTDDKISTTLLRVDKETIHQVAHTFTVGEVVRYTGAGTFTEAQANNVTNANAIGIVGEVIGVDDFVVVYSGWLSNAAFSGVTTNTIYYLDSTTAGAVTTTPPSTAIPIYIGNSANNIFVNIDRSAIYATASSVAPNVFINPGFETWQRAEIFGAVFSPSPLYTADRWALRCGSGTAGGVARDTLLPTGANSNYSFKITGNVGLTTCDVLQRIESANIADLKGAVTFQIWVYNNTGGAFTPSLLLGTPTAVDNFTTVTNRLTQTLASVPTTTWTQISHTVNISAYTNLANGLEVAIQVPSGSLNTTGKFVYYAEAAISKSSGIITFYSPPITQNLRDCYRYYMGSNAGNLTNGTYWLSAGAGEDFAYQTNWPVPMRAAPTITAGGGTAVNVTSQSWNETDQWGSRHNVKATAAGYAGYYGQSLTLTAEL